ncbi:chorismate synthase [Thermodesulfobacteriota bacterium]
MIRYLTAGESHGKQLTTIIEGVPSGLEITEDDISTDLIRRQGGYGRGGRMKIEKDRIEILSGVRFGETTGAPMTLVIKNKDFKNWTKKMSILKDDLDESIFITKPRPGHADLPGIIKYDQRDIRNILERSSARETATRVAVGAVAKKILKLFGIETMCTVLNIGGIKANIAGKKFDEIKELSEKSILRMADKVVEKKIKKLIDDAKQDGDTLGGTFQVAVRGVPYGLGSHVQYDKKLDAKLAAAMMSIQAIKGVEIGAGFKYANEPGSKLHDEILYSKRKGFYRETNNAGGIEGGMSNSEEITINCAMKPIPTLYKPLKSVDFVTKEPYEAVVERSDTCAVPAAAVIGEAVAAIEIANAMLLKFSSDNVRETKRNYDAYKKYVKSI